ncbi:MAG TPA: ATP-binding protein [Pseudolabrys sp.]|nr:ATP-binding protein [Pseudolabrys sp.]
MSRLWPLSLANQLGLLLVGAVVIAQVTTFAVLTSDRSDVRRGAVRTHAVDRMVTLVDALDAAPAAPVNGILAAFDSPRHRFWISEKPAVEDAVMDGDESRLADRLKRRLKRANTETRAALVERHESKRLLRHSKRPQAIQLSVKLTDGRWLNEEAPFRLGWGRRAFEILLASIFAILVVVILAVRWITRPMRAIVAATEKLGRGEAVEPLTATGPREVKALIDTFNVTQERLHRFVADRSRMAAALSHDLRTPITALRLRAELIEDDELRSAIVRTLSDMQRMIDATLALARDEATSEETRTVDLVALLDAIAEDCSAAGSEVTIDTPEQLPFRCRPVALRRALGNLIENAVRYGARARVTLVHGGDHVCILVDDDGPGLPADKLTDVFEPFVRLEQSRSDETGGIGLGLAIARSTIQAHGGNVVLTNRSEGGLRAEVTLPLSAPAGAKPELPIKETGFARA